MQRIVVSAVTVFAIMTGGSAIAKPRPITPLAPSMVAGVYERKVAGAPAKMTVKTTDGKKIEFSLTASLEHPKPLSASLSAMLPLKNNCAVYEKKTKGANYTISMRFTGQAVFLVYSGTGFGATGLDPSGVYMRTVIPH